MARQFYKEDNQAIPAIIFENTQPAGFTLITDPAEIKELYLTQYKARIDDGKNFVLNFTADRYIDILNEVYTAQQVFDLETHIKNIYGELNNGFWLTAQNTNANLTLSGIYDQAMKDNIQLILDNYVTDNY